MPGNSLQTVRDLANILNETDLSEIEYEQEKIKIKVVKNRINNAIVNSIQQLPDKEISVITQTSSVIDNTPAEHPGTIKSPMVGTAYLAPSAGAEPFTRVGEHVTKGQTLLIIEAMKVLNMIKSPKDGVVKQFLVNNEDPVEYDQPLLIVE